MFAKLLHKHKSLHYYIMRWCFAVWIRRSERERKQKQTKRRLMISCHRIACIKRKLALFSLSPISFFPKARWYFLWFLQLHRAFFHSFSFSLSRNLIFMRHIFFCLLWFAVCLSLSNLHTHSTLARTLSALRFACTSATNLHPFLSLFLSEFNLHINFLDVLCCSTF